MIAIGILLFVSMMVQFASVCIMLAIFGVMNGKKREEYK